MEIVVTDLTRMRDEHICIAGIDLNTGTRVRPKLAGVSVPEGVARQSGGTLRLGTVLAFANPWVVPSQPEIEDVIVPVEEMVERERMGAEEFRVLIRTATARVADQIDGLERTETSMIVREGCGHGSLAIAGCRRGFRLMINNFGRVRARLDANLIVSVTDLRLYQGAEVNESAVTELSRLVRDAAAVRLGVGLTRPFSPDGTAPVHWLQVNAIHLLGEPYWEP